MKVLHLITINAIGGAEKLISSFLPAQKNAGLETACILLYHKNYSSEPATGVAEGLASFGIPCHLLKYNSVFDDKARRQISEIVNQGGYDIIHSHLKHADFFMSGLLRRKEIRPPVVSTIHGYRDNYQGRFGLKASLRLYLSPYYWISRYTFRRFSGFVFISRCIADFYISTRLVPRAVSKVIYHGHAGGTASFAAGSNESDGGFALALPGRLTKVKGHQYAFEAVVMLKDEFPSLVLHLYGSGPEESALKALVMHMGIEDRVIFHGYVNDLHDQLRNARVVVVPSLGEAFGIVFLDAFASGVPAVAFDIPAGNEIIQHEVNGLLAKPKDAASLAGCIKQLLTNKELAGKITLRAAADLKEKYSFQRMVQDYTSFYDSVLTAKN